MHRDSAHMRDADRGSVVPAIVDNGQWSAVFGLSWASLMMRDQTMRKPRIIRPGGQYIRKVAGTMGVAAGRNEIAAAFLATRSEYLFMIDTDMGFDPDTVDRLIASAEASGALVMGALAFCLKADPTDTSASFGGIRHRIQPTVYEFLKVEDTAEIGFRPILDYPRDTVVQVAGTGAAALLVHRDALAAVGPDPFHPLTVKGGGGNGTDRTFSDDLSFCVRLAGADIDVYVDTSIKTTHEKTPLFLDEALYDRQRWIDREVAIQSAGHDVAASAESALRTGRPAPTEALTGQLTNVQHTEGWAR